MSKNKKESVGTAVAKGAGKFFVALLMFFILVGINVIVIGIAFNFIDMELNIDTALIVGIVLSLVYAIVVFAVPYLRSMKWTCRWWAILAILDAIWWGYLLLG